MPRKLSWDERCAEDAEGPVRLWSEALIPSGATVAQRFLKPLVVRSNRASGTIPVSSSGAGPSALDRMMGVRFSPPELAGCSLEVRHSVWDRDDVVSITTIPTDGIPEKGVNGPRA